MPNQRSTVRRSRAFVTAQYVIPALDEFRRPCSCLIRVMSFGCSRACSTFQFMFRRLYTGAAPNSYNCGGGCHNFFPLLMPFGVSGSLYDAQPRRYRWAVAVHVLSLNSYSSACTPKRPPPHLLSFTRRFGFRHAYGLFRGRLIVNEKPRTAAPYLLLVISRI